VRGLAPGDSRLAAGLTPKGKVLYVGRLVGEPDRFLLLLPRDAAIAVHAHLSKYAAFQKVSVRDVSDAFLLAALYAPADVAAPAGAVRLAGWGELSSEILAPAAVRPALEASLAAAGSAPIADEHAEALRIEAGRPRLGADATDANLPDEVGLEEAISRTKGCYVGQEIVARRKTYGKPTRRLVGLRFERDLLPPGTDLAAADRADRVLGRVTSAAISPRLGPIGLGIVLHEAPDGARLIAAGGAGSATLAPLPFP
jgi:folate-binding protein YgfZ